MFSWVRDPHYKTIDTDVLTKMGLQEVKVFSENQTLKTCVIRCDSVKSTKVSERRAVKKYLLTEGDSKAQATSWAYFKHEVVFLQAMKHPNIVRMTAALSCPNYLAVVMDCARTSLHDRLLYLAEERSVEIVNQLVDAVCYLHARRVVHGDTTLENVLYFPREGIVKLCDFSHAQAIPLNTNRPGDWKPQQSYQPPEIHHQHRWDAFKMDSYALGVLCFATLKKEYPKPGMDYLHQVKTRSLEEVHRIFLNTLLKVCPIQRQTVTQARHVLAKRKKPEVSKQCTMWMRMRW